MYQYPYGDTQQLNLDWILTKIKELEAGGSGGGSSIEDVANALISTTYNASNAYRRYDYCYYNGKLYRCLSDTTGTFNPADWQEVLIGDDIPILTRLINAIDAAAVMDVKFDTTGTNGKIQQKYNNAYHDVVEVDYTPVQYSKKPLSSNAGYELDSAIDLLSDSAIMDVKFDTSGTNGKLQQKYNNTYHDVVEVDYTPVQYSKKPLSSNAGYELNASLQSNITDLLSAIAVNQTTQGVLSGSLVNLTGTVAQNLSGHIVGNILLLTGRVRIAVSTRTGLNGGIRYSLPNNKVIDGTVNSIYAGMTSYTDAPRNGESTILAANNGSNYIDVLASESFANITAGKTLLLYVPPLVIKLKDT